MDVCANMTLGRVTLISTRLVVMEADARIDMLDVSSSREVLWLLQSMVENHHSSRPVGKSIKKCLF